MADYASVEFQTFNVSLTLKISSKKIVSATLELQLSCILLKEGKATLVFLTITVDHINLKKHEGTLVL